MSKVEIGNQLQVVDIQLGDGKEVVKGALITTHYVGLKTAPNSIPPLIAANHSSV